MTFTKSWKSIGAAALALAAISSVSVMTFAQEAKSVPMTKITASTPATACIPATAINGADSSKDTVVSVSTVKLTDLKGGVSMRFADVAKPVDVRVNEKTGKMEISEDGGKTWKAYEGEVMPAVACTPATPAKPAK